MAAKNSTQDVTATAAPIGAAARAHLSILNPTGSGATIYVGGPNVSASNATFVLAPGDPPWIADSVQDYPAADYAWYAVTASGTATGVCVCEA